LNGTKYGAIEYTKETIRLLQNQRVFHVEFLFTSIPLKLGFRGQEYDVKNKLAFR